MLGSSVPQTEKRTEPRNMQLLTWSLPLVGFGITLAVQIVLPRLLQLGLSEAEYAAFVAVTALASYIGLADGGIKLPLLRELTVLHSSGKRGAFRGEVARAAKFYGLAAVAGFMFAAYWLPGLVETIHASSDRLQGSSFAVASGFLLIATAISLAIGTLHSSVIWSMQRFALAQLVSLGCSVTSAVVLITALVVTRDLVLSIAAQALTLLVLDIGRLIHVLRLMRAYRDVPAEAPPRAMRRLIGDGLWMRVAEVLSGAAFPHAMTMLAFSQVAVAIPCRTLANGALQISMGFLNLLQVRVTNRLAQAESAAEGMNIYAIGSCFLGALHLLGVGAVGLLSQTIFSYWLPQHVDRVLDFLPGMLAEQALLSAALPASVLFIAEARLALWGAARAGGAVVGLLVFALGLPLLGEMAFGVGLAVAALPVFIVGAARELRRRPGSSVLGPTVWARYGSGLTAAALCVGYANAPTAVGIACAGLSLPSLVWSIRALWSLWRGR